MPPELASALKAGKLAEFKVDSSYDMWGLGMTLWVSALMPLKVLISVCLLYLAFVCSGQFVYFGQEFFHSFYGVTSDGTMGFDEARVIEYLTAPDLEASLKKQLDTLTSNPKLQSVMEKLLSVDPSARPSCDQVRVSSFKANLR